jgi:hypothetical protein
MAPRRWCARPKATTGAVDEVTIRTFCDPDTDTLCSTGSVGGSPLSCDVNTRACGVPCASDADRRGAGLVGFVCDRRPLEQVSPHEFPGDATPYEFCVNPTCS